MLCELPVCRHWLHCRLSSSQQTGPKLQHSSKTMTAARQHVWLLHTAWTCCAIRSCHSHWSCTSAAASMSSVQTSLCLMSRVALNVMVVAQMGELREPLMQQPSPSEQSGYAGPNARQEQDKYIPPGFTIQRQGVWPTVLPNLLLRQSATAWQFLCAQHGSYRGARQMNINNQDAVSCCSCSSL